MEKTFNPELTGLERFFRRKMPFRHVRDGWDLMTKGIGKVGKERVIQARDEKGGVTEESNLRRERMRGKVWGWFAHL